MKDEQELWIRKFLNYWHTFWHAIEWATDFSFSHWVCVGFGMMYVNILSKKLWFLSLKDTNSINRLIREKLWLNIWELSNHKLDFENLYSKMTNDKKNIDIKIRFTLLDRPGKLHIEKIWDDNKSLLKECFEEFRWK